MKTIADLLEAAGSDTVTVRGRIVRAVVRVPVQEGSTLHIIRRGVGAPRPQGLKLALNDGELEANGILSPAMTMWSHTAPAETTLKVRGAGAATMDVWNSWLLGEVDSAWIGNAGIVAQATDRGHLLRCSDGVGEPSFGDLVVELVVRKPTD
jgi:hypothetical protein